MPVKPNSERKPYCERSPNNQRSSTTIARRIAAGNCPRCGNVAPTDERYCALCKEAVRVANRNIYRKRHGIPLSAPLRVSGRPRGTRSVVSCLAEQQQQRDAWQRALKPEVFAELEAECLRRNATAHPAHKSSAIFRGISLDYFVLDTVHGRINCSTA